MGLDHDLVLLVLRNLTETELATMQQVCRQCADSAGSDTIWRDIFQATVGMRWEEAGAKAAWLWWNELSREKTVVLLTPDAPFEANKAVAQTAFNQQPKCTGVSLTRAHTHYYHNAIDFGGSINAGFRVPYSERLALGCEDFTVEAWIRIDKELSQDTQPFRHESYMLMSFGWQSHNLLGMDLYTNSAWHASHGSGILGEGEISEGGFLKTGHPTNVYNSSPEKFNEVCDGKYHHFAHVRSKDVLSLYQDGELVAQNEFTVPVDPQADLFVGSQGNNNAYHPREMSEFRIIRGHARYQGNFVPSGLRFAVPRAPRTTSGGESWTLASS